MAAINIVFQWIGCELLWIAIPTASKIRFKPWQADLFSILLQLFEKLNPQPGSNAVQSTLFIPNGLAQRFLSGITRFRYILTVLVLVYTNTGKWRKSCDIRYIKWTNSILLFTVNPLFKHPPYKHTLHISTPCLIPELGN